ncbi:MAG: alpha/beta fold hydrolase, partial [Acidimicrobiia bacterium]|nr:alpha/beta fold hydrolase [Acidimicrobiia bacterium]
MGFRTVVVAGAVLILGACSSGGTSRSSATTETSKTGATASTTTPAAGATPDYAVGVRTETFENASRALTAKDGDPPPGPRVLETTIYYPARGTGGGVPTDDPPIANGGPFPLIVFAHGFSASPSVYAGLTAEWARAGYVVAVPRFPGSNAAAVGGPDAGDYVNQPADVHTVISGMTEMSRQPGGPLAGLVRAGAVGVAGHSLGGITTLGAAANTCCRDRRIGAAVVLSGDPLSFPTGKFDYAKTPPLLLVHGTA